MAKKSEIIKSLQKLTKTEAQGDDESRNEFLERLATGSSEYFEDKDDEWEAQPKAAQSWVNAAVKAINAGKTIVDPDEVKDEPEADESEEETEGAEDNGEEDADDHDDDGEEQPDEEESDMEQTTTKAKKRSAKKAPAKKAAKKKVAPAKKATAAAKPAKKAASRGNGAVRGTGAQTLIKQIMLKDPSVSTEDLIARLEKKGLKPTKVAVTSIRSGMRHTLRVMADAGVLHNSIKLSKEA
jgi:hypothetical protein